MTVWRAIELLGSTVWTAYQLSSIIAYMMRKYRPAQDRSRFLSIRMECKPFALPALAAMYLPRYARDDVDMWVHLSLLVSLASWWLFRSDPDDDDRWKRRRKRAASKVAEIGGRLQVVPEGASA